MTLREFTIPSNATLSLIRNTGWQQKFVPRNFDTTVYDCTFLAPVELWFYQTGAVVSDAQKYNSYLQLINKDETGLTVALLDDEVEQLISRFQKFAYPVTYALMGSYTDTQGTHSVVLAQGSVSYSHRERTLMQSENP